ncbi:MAG TPA: hypothetical protein VM686_23510, partial [Polyangiaceae bacterium]|nr:hypothetical protein [Polyangiaceae bacterium]
MTPQERIAALEGMLARIQRNVSRPRSVAPVVTAPVAAPVLATPLATRAPSSAPPPPKDAAFDRTVDELLEAPIPVHTSTQQRSAVVEPISIEPPPPRSQQPPPRDEALLEAEEAAIPLITPGGDLPAMSGVQLAGQAVEVEISTEETDLTGEELGEDDLISVPPEASKSEPPPELDIPVHDELDFDEDEEEAGEEMPASSQRPRAAAMEEALAAAAEEHEVPIKTPPPESGPQEAMPTAAALESPRLPDIREAFERGPTPEQLGETIELPEAGSAELELDVRAAEPAAEPVSEELEVALPVREASSAFDAN